MILSFNKSGDKWVAEFTATGVFNLHVESNETGSLTLEQKTQGNDFAFSENLPNQKVHDVDIAGLIFPKQIRISSTKEVSLAIVTF